LWNEAEKAERRKDARVAILLDMALPLEMGKDEWIKLMESHSGTYTGMGFCVDVAIHDRGGGNPHAHVLLTARPVEGGLLEGKKPRDWRDISMLTAWRGAWARDCNEALAGRARIDHRSLEAQSLDRVPTIYLGRAAAEMEKRGERTERGDRNRSVAMENASRAVSRMAGAARSYADTLEKIKDGRAAAAAARREAEYGSLVQIEAIRRMERQAEAFALKLDGLERERTSLHFWQQREKARLMAEEKWLEKRIREARAALEAKRPELADLQRDAGRLEAAAKEHEARAEELESRELPAIEAFYRHEREKTALRPEREIAEELVLEHAAASLERGGFASEAVKVLELEEAERWIKAREREKERERQLGHERAR